MRINIKVENNCDFAKPLDSVEVVMEFVDEDGKRIVDAEITTKAPANDTNFRFRMRLKDSDQWSVTRVRGTDGKDVCIGCIDTSDLFPCQMFITSESKFVPVDSPAVFRANCRCRN